MKRKLTHTITCFNKEVMVTVFIVERPEQNQFWWAIKGSCMAHLCAGKPFKSNKQLEQTSDIDVFTYYGDGNASHPDRITDLKTFQWLLRNK